MSQETIPYRGPIAERINWSRALVAMVRKHVARFRRSQLGLTRL